jgi:hypothetical protein
MEHANLYNTKKSATAVTTAAFIHKLNHLAHFLQGI